MNKLSHRLGYCFASLFFTSTLTHAASTIPSTTNLSDSPLFMANNVDANIMFSIDDSGSMDFETLFPSNDGALWWDSSSQSFINPDGSLRFGPSGTKYSYLFPNGYNNSYNGQRLYTDSSHPAIPPVLAYAFSRSSAYNKSYYNSNTTYQPWDSFGGYSFNNSSPTAAPFEPVSTRNSGGGTLDLTQNRNVGGSEETFRIQSGMICDNAGGTSCNWNQQISYFPATFYEVDTTSTYTYDTTVGGGPTFHTDNSLLLEAESASGGGNFSPLSTVAHASASDGSYIELNSGGFTGNGRPSDGHAVYSFTLPASMSNTVSIWVRVRLPDGGSDSMFMHLQNHDSSQITADDGDQWYDQTGGAAGTGDEYWYRWRDGHNTSSNFVWERWAVANLSGSNHQLTIAYREAGAGIDQILISNNTSDTPSGILSLSSPPVSGLVTRDCSVAADISPQYYRDFQDNHSAFSGIDSIGPDGACLKKYEIKSTTASYPSGRSYNEEIQNFANWFTYYRKRHMAMRGGLAASINGLSNIRAGMFWINNRRTVTMYDLGNSGELSTFLQEHYEHVRSGGTPNREALNHAGQQFMRTDSNAPIIAECQKNFAMHFTDGYTNLGSNMPSPGNADGSEGTPYADTYDDSFADIAMYYYKTNLRPDITPAGAVNAPDGCDAASPDPSLDCNKNLHMSTYTVGLGANGTIFNQTHFKVADAYTSAPNWPNTGSNRDATQIDDLYHAAVNGRGEMLNAKTPTELKDSMKAAITDIISKLGNSSGVTFNTSTLGNDSVVMTARFNSSSWSGELQAFNLDGNTGDIGSLSWEAATVLNSMDPDDRFITTYDGTSSVTFEWANLTNAQKDDLNTGPGGSADGQGADRLAYFRGDHSKEGGSGFRPRDIKESNGNISKFRLGDIVHSSPIFVGPPEMSYPDSAPFGDGNYSGFKNSNANRDPIVYVGANDGMLHGFRTTSSGSDVAGQEVLAYIPNLVYSTSATGGLHYLTDPDYEHRYYIDGSPTVADAYIGGSWKTILFGGLRGGGPGIFALDVTDPTQFNDAGASNLALWEFSPADHSGLGITTGKPVVAMMNNNKWALVFGNGYGAGTSKLFVLYIEGGTDGNWSSTDYEVIDTGTGNGLSSPALADLDQDGKVDRIYAGDVNGNMWVFDVTSSNDNQWAVAHKQGSNAKPLFTALNDSGEVQPITASPVITLNPNTDEDNNNEPNVLVLFGTGQYLLSGDITNDDVQGFYAVWDRKLPGSKNPPLVRADLEGRSISQSGGYRDVTGDAVDWEGSSSLQYGWYIDFNVSGDEKERVVLTPQVRGEILFFNTLIPSVSACTAGGRGWLMSVNLRDGLTPDFAVFDSDGDGDIDGDDIPRAGELVSEGIPSISGFLGDHQYTPTSIGDLLERDVETGDSGGRTGRLSWIELISE